MCHNSGIESGEQQIERYIAYGMPSKAIKSVKYTMRKREKQQQQQQQQQEQHQQQQKPEHQLQQDGIEEMVNTKMEEELDESICCNDTSSDSDDSGMDTTTKQQLEENLLLVTATISTENHNLNLSPTTKPLTATKEEELKRNSNSGNIIKIPKLCGRFSKVQQQEQLEMESNQLAVTATNDSTISSNMELDMKIQQQRKLSSMEPSMDDALAIGTQMTRKFAERLYYLIIQLQNSRLYAILTRTTQPAHLIAICILSFVLVTVGPDLIETSSTNYYDGHNKMTATTKTITEPASSTSSSSGTTLAALAYLGAFATHFGAQIWMTFVSGLSLYFSLPRHTFGQCQQILFPKYFALNAVLSISMLIIYAKYFWITWTTSAGLQVCTLALTAFIEVVVRLYLVPPMLLLMHEKYKLEDAIGSGQEVGVLVQGDLVHCPHYQRIHKGFRRIHMIIAIGNMTVMLATCLQLYFLASKIHFS